MMHRFGCELGVGIWVRFFGLIRASSVDESLTINQFLILPDIWIIHALLADEVRARRVVDRRSRRDAEKDDGLVRRAELPGAQFHARSDARRRPRLFLSFELSRARDCRHRASEQGRLSRSISIRPQEPLPRPESNPRRAALAQCGRDARKEDAPCPAP